MARLLLQGGLLVILAGAFFINRPRWAKPMLTLGLLALFAGLLGRGNLSDGFHLELFMEETLLISAGWGAALLVFLHRGNGRGSSPLCNGTASETASGSILLLSLVFCLVPVCILGLLLPWPDGTLDLKLQHISAPLFFLFEALGCVFFSLASLLAWEVIWVEWRQAVSEGDSFKKQATNSEYLMDLLLFWGFITFSTSQAAGAYWAWAGWSAPFHWNDRHLLSAAVWCFYSAALHLRFTSWPRRIRHYLVAASMIPLLFLQLVPDLLRAFARWTGGTS